MVVVPQRDVFRLGAEAEERLHVLEEPGLVPGPDRVELHGWIIVMAGVRHLPSHDHSTVLGVDQTLDELLGGGLLQLSV